MPKPLKRAPALQPLSRQHHKVLQCCFKIRKGLDSGVEEGRIVNYLHYFWQNYYLEHAKLQAKALNPLLTEGQRAVMENKEREIRLLYESVRPEFESLIQFEKKLYQYVRWEERILFEAIQELIGISELQKVLPVTYELDDWCELFNDQFWL